MSSRGGLLSPATKRDIETFLDESMVEHDVPGSSVAVLDRDGLLHATGLGARNIESREPATPETLYSVGSVTKSFTAMAVLQLVERDSLALDDEIRRYVDFWNDVPGDPITVHDLLSHSSGMPNDYAGSREPLFSETPPTSPLVTREDEIRHANGAADRRIADPEGYLYSNRGYEILGHVVENVADRTHRELVEEELFAPLGMDRSQVGFGQLSEAADDAMTGYRIDDGEPIVTDFDLEATMDPPFAAGGILSSVTELAAMVRCLLNGGELDGARVLKSELVAAMCSHQAPAWETIDGGARGYGYGMRLGDFLDETLAGHTGTSPNARAYAGMLRERGVGVALCVNTASVPIDQLARGVLAIAVGEPPEAVSPYLSLRRKLEAVAGTYEGYRGGLTVTVEPAESEGHIDVAYEDGPGWEFPAFPESLAPDDYAFYRVRSDGVRVPVTFHETGSGLELRYEIDCLRRTTPGS